MNVRTNASRNYAAILLGFILSIATANAAGPLPYDGQTPPANVNVAFVYNQFASASSYFTTDGTKINNTRIRTDVPILRLVHTFKPIPGVGLLGVQVIAPYVMYLGSQEKGGTALSHGNGFAEPQLSVFLKMFTDPRIDQTLTLAYFLSPPVGTHEPGHVLNPGSNAWVNNIEIGYTHLLFGHPGHRRLDIQLWADGYFYGDNNDYLIQTRAGALPARLRTQPAGQIIVYLPYIVDPATAGYVGLSFEQTFGGKQTLTSDARLLQGRVFDTGTRNNFTRLGLIAGSFIAPTVFMQGEIATDLRARGGVADNVFAEIQIGTFF